MLVSIVNPDEVKYKVHRKIDVEDIDYSSYVYETTLFDKDIEIVLGKEKHTYSNYDITHFSIYLIFYTYLFLFWFTRFSLLCFIS